MNISLNTLPVWIPGLIMIYTGVIWLLTIKKKVRMDSRSIAYTLLAWGVLYIVGSFGSSAGTEDELVVRVFLSRIVISLLCLSQSLPLTISYVRTILRERKHDRIK
jgi:hypothetical protein